MHALLAKIKAERLSPEDEIFLRAKIETVHLVPIERSRALRISAQRLKEESKRIKREMKRMNSTKHLGACENPNCEQCNPSKK